MLWITQSQVTCFFKAHGGPLPVTKEDTHVGCCVMTIHKRVAKDNFKRFLFSFDAFFLFLSGDVNNPTLGFEGESPSME